MLSKVCNKIVNLLIENHIIQKDDREIYYFGLYQMISFIFNTITTLVIVSFFNMYIEGLLFCVFYYLLRCYGGGYHSKSVIVCYILSILLIKLCMLFTNLAGIISCKLTGTADFKVGSTELFIKPS